MADKPSSGTSWQTRLPKYTDSRGTNTAAVTGPTMTGIGIAGTFPTTPFVSPAKPPPAPPAEGTPTKTNDPSSRPTGGPTEPQHPVGGPTAPLTPPPRVNPEGPSNPMIHGPIPKFNGPIVRPIAGPSFGPGLIPGRGTPKRSGGYHPPDFSR